MEITRGTIQKALRVVVYGPEGIGKTTFASKFPAPVFIDTENSTEFLDVARFPKPSSWTMLLEEVQEMRRHPEFRTLIIDTADWAEKLCKAHVCAARHLNSIEDPGYGKGYVYLAEEWGRLLDALTELRDLGVNVVLTAHAAMRKFEQPDEMGAYDRWELKLEKKNAPLTKEWADMILFANYEIHTVKTGDGKAAKSKAQGGKRVMYASHHPCWDAKNRQGLPDKMPFDYAQIAACIPNAAAGAGPETLQQPPELARAEGVPLVQPGPEPGGTGRDSGQGKAPGSAGPAGDPPTEAAKPQDTPDPATARAAPPPEAAADPVPAALRDLMDIAHVTEEEVREVIAGKGYFPPGTPWGVMEREGFVEGWILPFWGNIVQVINDTPGRLPF